eukprot:661909-Alexandrium_andersonii.AAC.1
MCLQRFCLRTHTVFDSYVEAVAMSFGILLQALPPARAMASSSGGGLHRKKGGARQSAINAQARARSRSPSLTG